MEDPSRVICSQAFLGKARMEWGMGFGREEANQECAIKQSPIRGNMGQSPRGSLIHVGHSQTVLVIA